MKKISLLISIIVCFILINTSCTNDDTVEKNTAKSSIIKTAKSFGERHNEGLNYIYQQLSNGGQLKSLSVSDSDLKTSVLVLTNNFINLEIGYRVKSAQNETYFTVEDYEQYPIEKIKEEMSEREYYYVSQIEQDINGLINGKSFDYLINQVVNDELLDNNQKTAVCIYICTAEKSAEYWKENYSAWQALTGNDTRLKLSASQERVLLADCWWGWFGFLSSGCNPVVGAGGAIAGSALSALNN